MKQYIVNLTDYLINKNHFDDVYDSIKDQEELLLHIKVNLENGDVRAMCPEKLGEIMCSFEVGDVLASQKDLLTCLHFRGNCEQFLIELVSLCLAFTIRGRLETECLPGMPRRWKSQGPDPFRKALKNHPAFDRRRKKGRGY